ncbi:MAG: hypothetical protein ABI954_07085 [Pyrinomonadaceae bacterium]
MTLREQLVEKVKNMPEQSLEELLKVVEDLEQRKSKPSAMEQLRQIKISAATDFSTTVEIYPTVKRNEQ